MRGSTLDFQLLFESSPDVLLVLLPDAPRFTMVAATDARLEATHATREQTLGRGVFEVFPDNPDDPAATGANNLRASLERVLATKRPDTMAVQKYDIRGPDGAFHVKYWSPKNIPVLSNSGEILYILHRVEDVTELVQASEVGQELRDRTHEMEREVIARSRELADANANLRDANTRLGELDRAKTAFFSNVSHEFRTPLTLILGPVEHALGTSGLRGDELEAVHRNALRLLRLVNSLLDFSRLESGRLELRFVSLDLAELTRGIAAAFQSLFDDAGLRLVIACPPLSEAVYVDPAQWEKLVMNLISNAFKFTFEGEVAVSLSHHDGHVELSVRDTGTGMPAHELPRVFERFHRVEGSRGRSFEGTGIGLSLVDEIARQHGGSVRVTSEVGEGSTFVVSLPAGRAHLPPERVVDDAPVAAAEHRRAAAVLEARQWLGLEADRPPQDVKGTGRAADGEVRGRLLVADDNADMRSYFQRVLSPHWDVKLVSDGRAAFEAALAAPPELILSDVMMPEMDGFALVDALRGEPRTHMVPIILVSARAGEEARLSGLETGADDYLVKPFSTRELLTRVRTHLEMGKVRRAAAEASLALAETRAQLLQKLEQEHAELLAAHAELKSTQALLVQSAKMASLGQLVAGIAHEINNPLAIALAHLGTIERNLDTVADALGDEIAAAAPAPWERALSRVHEALVGLKRIQDLIHQLRTFSRLDEGDRKLVSVRESIESVLTILRHRFGDEISIVTDFGEPDHLECFASLFNQAVMNLVANAVDAVGERGEITLTTRAHAGSFELTVTDTGHGIPNELRDRVFEPFFTTKPVGHGTGLGLSITYSIAKKHGGMVELSPRDGGGTVAKLEFPLAVTQMQ